MNKITIVDMDNSLEVLHSALSAIRIAKAKENKSIPISALLDKAQRQIVIAIMQIQRPQFFKTPKTNGKIR